ncbi:MAG: nucleoside triphosphate pyrophosphohydrolase [Candidatus Marinimicrobia bacterium]|jgi:tetrapyrrole methylase family protein/MazG family protein|nr:nucleoside triphosphate pyrophosphohydrolase [Candidatus Neomarinimicrobiota bacterium]MBT3944467.1 nucleoside triphosphate pyrophosphohydrolase [Candidatus Neomarinimicrobiota bacterium]MBT4706291.1 nucleoside triphosphate pyrophosphohydrolase [Candidatus Neomarinimicrobiota bacterium]MBT4926113.1 nucleoside triphosphate pyrophosphohydrolase [Candidatus Neomarinimicrobiota bacterium]MBT5251541.1 nucleoside triphosphate pyrophosphohydrolase [Candidatus Neomarinimicrobiota bacterium]
MNSIDQKLKDLISLVEKLRAPDGCDWDRKQTSETLIPYLLEESHEVVEAILENKPSLLREELGDLLLNIVFQAVLASEKKEFTMEEVIDDINKKIVNRHSHIFSNDSTENYSSKKNWELNKKKQKKRDSILDGVPNSLSPLIVSHRLQDKSAAVGFEWSNIEQAIKKIDEELKELKLGIKNQDKNNIEEEIGDLLTTIVNLSRFLNISSELALKKANKKFYNRFTALEKLILLDKKIINDLSLDELMEYWKKVKYEER